MMRHARKAKHAPHCNEHKEGEDDSRKNGLRTFDHATPVYHYAISNKRGAWSDTSSGRTRKSCTITPSLTNA